MRSTVDPADLSHAAYQVRRAALACRGVAQRLEPLAGSVPQGGATSAVLADVVARWRVRERAMDSAMSVYAASLAAAASGYGQAEGSAAVAMRGLS